MVSEFMIPAFRCRVALFVSLVIVCALAVDACQKVPLLAPTGSSITLTSDATALPLGGAATVTAQLLEASGTPPHSGTLVIFTTMLGTVDPPQVQTDINGRATGRFTAGNASGIATVTASSGGASGGGSTSTTAGATTTTGPSNVVRIALGAAAAGQITVSANPNPVQPTNGRSTISAVVGDSNGNALSGIPVTFSTDAGSVSPAFATTDGNGVAITSLSTSKTAKVTAKAGISSGSGTTATPALTADVTVAVLGQPTVTISSPTTTPTVNAPVSFTIAATPTTGNAITSLVVSYGDGATDFLTGNATTVQHTYTTASAYTVRATATESTGATGAASTVIVVQSQAPIVTLASTQSTVGANTNVSFTATVTPASTNVVQYLWNFGDGSSQTTTTPTANHPYVTLSLPKTATVTVTNDKGQTATASTIINP